MALNPEHDDPIKLANKFGTFFFKKIEIIKENLDKFKSLDLFLLFLRPHKFKDSTLKISW